MVSSLTQNSNCSNTMLASHWNSRKHQGTWWREKVRCVFVCTYEHINSSLNALFTNQAAHLHLHSTAPPLVSCLCIDKIGKLNSITFFLRAFWSDRDSMQFSEYIVYLTTPYKLYKLVYIPLNSFSLKLFLLNTKDPSMLCFQVKSGHLNTI